MGYIVNSLLGEQPRKIQVVLDTEGSFAGTFGVMTEDNAMLAGAMGLLPDDVRIEATRLCETYPGPDASQDEARQYNATMRQFVAAHPHRVEAATRVTMQLNSERLKPRFLETWESVNFYLPHVRKTMGQMEAEGRCTESEEYAAILQRIKDAEAEVARLIAAADEPTDD